MPQSKRTILLVGPEPALRTIARLHLTGGRLEVAEPESIAAACEAARSGAGDAAVIPFPEGLRWLEELRVSDEECLRALPVLLVGDAPSKAARARAAELGAQVLPAPVTGPRLAAAVSRLISGLPSR